MDSPPPLGLINLNFNGYALGNLSQLRIGDVNRDHNDTALRAFSKLAGIATAIKTKILALLQANALDLSNFLVERDIVW